MTVPAIVAYDPTDLTTISLPIHTVSALSYEDAATEFKSPSGLSQWLFVDAYIGQVWAVTIPCLTTVQRDALITFWKACRGRVIPFIWTHPHTQATHYVRFGDSGLSFNIITAGFWTCAFTLAEAHPLEIDVSGV